MSWNATGRREELPADWTQRRAHVIQREQGQCQWLSPITGNRCLERGNEVHHTDRNNHAVNSLVLLCTFHHMRITTKQSAQARRKARAKAWAKPKHPGLL